MRQFTIIISLKVNICSDHLFQASCLVISLSSLREQFSSLCEEHFKALQWTLYFVLFSLKTIPHSFNNIEIVLYREPHPFLIMFYCVFFYYPNGAFFSQGSGLLVVPSFQLQNGRQSLQLSEDSPVEPIPTLGLGLYF